MTVDTNLQNWNKENESSTKTVRFVEPETVNLYKNSRKGHHHHSNPINRVKSLQSRVKSDPEANVGAEFKADDVALWSKIREKL